MINFDKTQWIDNKDAWSCRELAYFLCGKEPNSPLRLSGEVNEINEMIQEIERAVVTKKLIILEFPSPIHESNLPTDFWYFDTIACIHWAVNNIKKYPKFPFILEDLISRGQLLQQDLLINKSGSIKPKAAQQKELIIKIIKSMNFDPDHLPEEKRGKSGVRSRVKKIALQNKSMFSESSFDHAWKSFRKSYKK